MTQQFTSLLMYSLYAPTWTARKLDKKATAQVKEANGVKEGTDVGNFNKLILPDCDELKAITSFVGATRTDFYLRTAPWGEARGTRVGKAEEHMDLMAWFGDRKDGLVPLLTAFGAVYDAKIAEAEYKMHGIFDIQDYPPWDVVESKFSLRLSVQPLPNVNDVRVLQEIPAHIRQEIEDSINEERNSAFAMAVREAFEQLLKPVAHMAKQLKAYDAGEVKKIYASLTENVNVMADAARRLNITRDPQIEALASECEALVEGVTQEDLKKSDAFRVEKAKAAEKLAARIAQFIPQ